MNSSDFNEALTSFKTFAEAIFSGQDKSQKLRLCGMMKNLSIPAMINILPPELLEKIFKLLNFKDTCQANLICRRWNEIIVRGNVLKTASGKTSTLPVLFKRSWRARVLLNIGRFRTFVIPTCLFSLILSFLQVFLMLELPQESQLVLMNINESP